MSFFEEEEIQIELEEETTPEELTRHQKFVLDLHDLVCVLAVFMVAFMMLFRMVVVVGPSMNDTLVDGDRLILLSNALYRTPKQGDIIVASKESFRGGECVIKRVIAVEGQTIDIDFATGTVYVDGVALEEEYISSPTIDQEGMSFPLLVEEGHVFCMGDNRCNSADSRDPDIGLIDEREILGKAIFLLMPGTNGGKEPAQYDRIGVID